MFGSEPRCGGNGHEILSSKPTKEGAGAVIKECSIAQDLRQSRSQIHLSVVADQHGAYMVINLDIGHHIT